MRGVCLYFVAQCAFVPTHTVLAKCFSVCLLISMVCSAVFLGLIGWIIDRGCRPVCFFLGERIPTVRERICRLTEQLRATAGADECWFVVLCFCLQTLLFVLLWLTCSAPQLPRFVGLADSFFDFELPIRQIER